MTKFSRLLDLNNKKGLIAAIALAIIFISIIIVGYYLLVIAAPPEGFSSMYILDGQKKTESYPEFLIIDQNNTFNVWVGVENHKGFEQSFEIQQKLTKDPILTFPINEEANNKFTKILQNQEKWEIMVTTTISDPGNYSLVFELYLQENGQNIGDNIEPINYVLLNLQADYQNQD